MIEVTKKFSKKIVVAILATVISGFATIVLCNVNGIIIQDSAIVGFFGVLGGEFGLLAFIKTKKSKTPATGQDESS